MIGSIIGDIIGSRFEGPKLNKQNINSNELIHKDCRFTDDTVLTIAVMDCLLNNNQYIDSFKKWGRKYINSGFSSRFKMWLINDMPIIPSFGNGSAMRISPIPFYYKEYSDMIKEAEKSCKSTHNTLEGIRGGLCIAEAIFKAKIDKNKDIIISYLEEKYGFSIKDKNLEDLHKNYIGNATCEGTVSEALYCFYISNSFVDCMKKCIYIGGDTDTICAMAGGICEAYYGIDTIDNNIRDYCFNLLPNEFTNIIKKFYEQVG